MGEPVEVDAKPIDDELATITKAERWLAGAAERVAERCELYRPPERIESEKERKDAVAARAQCRKDAAEIDAERKALLRGMEDAIKKFKTEVKDVLSPLTDLDARYKNLLDEYEDMWRTNRQIELTKEYAALAPDLADLVPFDRILARFGNERGRVWLNRSTNVVLAKQMLAEAIDQIADAEGIIREQVDEQDVRDTLLSYFQHLDLQRALSSARSLREQRERLARLEEERKAREAMWEDAQAVTKPEPQPEVEASPLHGAEVPHAWVMCVSLATRGDMLKVRDFAKSIGVSGSIYSGTVSDVYERVVMRDGR